MSWQPPRRKPLDAATKARIAQFKVPAARLSASRDAAKEELARLQKAGYVIPQIVAEDKAQWDEDPQRAVFGRERIVRAVAAHMEDPETYAGTRSLSLRVLHELNARRDLASGHESDSVWLSDPFTLGSLVGPYTNAYRAAFLDESEDDVSVGWRILAMVAHVHDPSEDAAMSHSARLRWDALARARRLEGIPRIYGVPAPPTPASHPRALIASVAA